MESFLVALNAVMPFLLYIGFGYGMQRTPLVDDAFLNRLNRMIFNAFFPIMMFQNLYSTPEGFSLDPKLAGFAVASLLTLQAILLIAGTNPLMDDKYDPHTHKRYMYIVDKRNPKRLHDQPFDFKAYMREVEAREGA